MCFNVVALIGFLTSEQSCSNAEVAWRFKHRTACLKVYGLFQVLKKLKVSRVSGLRFAHRMHINMLTTRGQLLNLTSNANFTTANLGSRFFMT